ncbi:MAG: hypothetical protein LBD20_01150 [Spirochaetaceae bacterium]|jgi:hypothetical protein|nr:hypothetical protein [Spirochaetaceae bacterium]
MNRTDLKSGRIFAPQKPGYPLQFGRLLTQPPKFRFYPLRVAQKSPSMSIFELVGLRRSNAVNLRQGAARLACSQRHPCRPFLAIFAAFICVTAASCATGTITFVPIRDFSISSGVDVVNIDDFEDVVRTNRVKTVFYTEKYFVAQVNGILYTLESRSYTSFREYREGKLKEPVPWAVFKPAQER